jgi:hypothetical protein
MAISFELISAFVGFIFTVLILSYLLGDNPLFRVAVYIFVGVSAGYAAAVAWRQVILPMLWLPLWNSILSRNLWQIVLLFFPLIGGVLLLAKIFPRLAGLGRLPMAYLVGVGAAIAIGGAALGTLFPQIKATIANFDVQLAVTRNINPALMILNGGFVLLGTVGTLAYFHFGARRKEDGTVHRLMFVETTAWIGRVYIAITFGVLFAGVYMAALTALIERMDSIRNLIILLEQAF